MGEGGKERSKQFGQCYPIHGNIFKEMFLRKTFPRKIHGKKHEDA